jgi:hypothetical protein
MLEAMKAFCEAWAGTYDAVFYCCDRFDQHQAGDAAVRYPLSEPCPRHAPT